MFFDQNKDTLLFFSTAFPQLSILSPGTLNTAKNNGNIESQTITAPTVGTSNGFTAVQTYIYDSLNRIDDATEMVTPAGSITATQSWKQDYIFDRYGNRNFIEANTTTIPRNCADSATPPNPIICDEDRKTFNPGINAANNRLSSSDGYQFDAAGNTTRDPQLRKFTYDAENKQTKVESVNSSGTVTGTIGEYFSDGDGRRVKKIAYSNNQVTETTVFVYDASSRLVAEYSTIPNPTPQVAYLTNDHLGSPRINTNENGAVTSRHDYLPFGEEIQSGTGGRTTAQGYGGQDPVRQKFTSYERDIETDLDFAQARYYSNQHGRFTSVDPIMMEKRRLVDPQAINLYLYTRNNPLKYVDPDGEKFKGTDDQEVIIEREKVNGKKIWVIKSGNASKDLQKLVSLINDSGSRTASNMFKKLNKHDTMINFVIDKTTPISQEEHNRGSYTSGLHQPHDKNGDALDYDTKLKKFNGVAEQSPDNEDAYKEATITLFQGKLEEDGFSGAELDGKLVSIFGHEARHDLDPKQVRAGINGTGSDDIWHPEKNGKPKKNSPDYFGDKIRKQIEKSKGITIRD